MRVCRGLKDVLLYNLNVCDFHFISMSVTWWYCRIFM